MTETPVQTIRISENEILREYFDSETSKEMRKQEENAIKHPSLIMKSKVQEQD